MKEEKCPCHLNHTGFLKRNLSLGHFFFLTEYRERRERVQEIKISREREKKEGRKDEDRIKNREGGGKRQRQRFLKPIRNL